MSEELNEVLWKSMLRDVQQAKRDLDERGLSASYLDWIVSMASGAVEKAEQIRAAEPEWEDFADGWQTRYLANQERICEIAISDTQNSLVK